MEVSATRTRRFAGPVPKSRTITGPTPHSVSILERPKLTRPPDWLTLERIKKEDHRDGYVKVVDYNDKNSLRNLFLEKTDHKIQLNTIRKRVDSMLLHESYSLDERRDRLRDLFTSEEQIYLTEMVDKEETVLEKQARMRERARSLREKREMERVAEADAKLEQRWRNQCEELRGVKIKKHLQEVTQDRAEQLRLKDEEVQRKQKEEDMYAKLWKEDWEVKCQREEMETVLQIERNKEMLDLLNTQTAARQCEKEDLRILKAKEAEILREEAALRAMEEVKLQEDKRRKQRMTKKSLDYSLKLKMKHRAKEVQEELAFDMKLLEQMLTECSNDAKDNLERKKQLKEEVQIYRGYLHEQAEEELRREKELDTIVTSEVEKQWNKRAEQWQREADARKELLHDVMETRKQQVQRKLSLIAQEKAQVGKDRAEVLKNLEEHQQLERHQQEGRYKTNKTHQKHLIQQMEYLTSAQGSEKQQIKDDWALCIEAEAIYKKKVQAAIKDMGPVKLHPTRLVLSGKLV